MRCGEGVAGRSTSARPPAPGEDAAADAPHACGPWSDVLAFGAMGLDLDPATLGAEFDRAVYGPVTAEELIEFARALDAGPEYTTPAADLVAHPTFCVSYKGNKFFPDNLPRNLLGRMSFDAGKDVELGEPIRPGDMVTVVSTLHDVYEKTGRSGTMVFVVVRFTLTNQHDQLLARVDNRFMYRGDR